MKYYFKGHFSNKEKNEILLPRNLCVGHNKNIWKENFYFYFYIKRISCWGQGIHNYTIFKRFLFLVYYRKRGAFPPDNKPITNSLSWLTHFRLGLLQMNWTSLTIPLPLLPAPFLVPNFTFFTNCTQLS